MIFVITVIVTVSRPLIGVASGIFVKFIFHILNGAPLRSCSRQDIVQKEEEYYVP
jgi:hypothetical protein